VWQALRAELHPAGLEVVTVGVDAAGPDACRPYIERAKPEHPSLVDATHQLAEHFGIVNIPSGVWIDEEGVIVRPPEPAFPHEAAADNRYRPVEGFPDRMNDILAEASRIRADPRYVPAVRDWVERGPASRYALAPDEVVRRSRPRGREAAEAQAHVELGAALWSRGDRPGAEEHWRLAHRLDPDNFTARRQAWSLASEGVGGFERFWQGPVPGREEEWPYDTEWLTDVRAMGAEHYYPPLEL
jgi:hypothetical protein